MQALRKTVMVATLVGGLIASATAAEQVTIMYRSGERATGRFDGISQGRFYLDVSDTDERKIPLGDIALIDTVGAAQGLPETELSQARGSQHLLLLKNGSATKGQLVTIEGDSGKPGTVVFRTESGEERRVPLSEVGRIYLGNFPGGAGAAPSSPTAMTAASPAAPGVVRVNANEKWVDTGITVQTTQMVSFSSSGQVQLSANDADKAGVSGTPNGRKAPGAQAPDLPVGALVARIGNGPAFAIGGQASVQMPSAGRLYLAVNDDENGDNKGYFDVRVTPSSVPRRRS